MVDLSPYENAFTAAINDDLNVSKALAVVWDMVRRGEAGANITEVLNQFDAVLGLDLMDTPQPCETALPVEIMALIHEREIARNNKAWQRADEIRDSLLKLGITLIDTEDGTQWEIKETRGEGR